MGGMFGFRPNSTLSDLFLAPQTGNEAHWQQRLANQGSIGLGRPTLAGRLENATVSGLRKAGVENRRAVRTGGRVFSAINDFTPVGNATMAADAGSAFGAGYPLQGLGLGALAMLPGGVGRKAKSLTLYHGGPSAIDRFDPKATVDGGFHFGTEAQAQMRSGKRGVLTAAELDLSKVRRSVDMGGNWKQKIASAKSAGHDGIVYLNRYEGLTTDVIERLHSQGLLHKLDAMSDAQFRKVVPEAQDSYIAFYPEQIRKK
jgi:hypothetical protein